MLTVNPYSQNPDITIRLRNGDKLALELLFRTSYSQLCGYARKFLQDTDDAEEIVQDVFYQLWENRLQLDENKSLQGYLFTIVRNNSLNLIESKKCRTRYADMMKLMYLSHSHDNNNSYHELLASDLEDDLRVALAQLPQECRKVFVLSRTEGLKYHEIATRLNVSIKTVETQMSRALSKLRLQLKGHMTILLLFSLLG